jgi:hypothetical protein
MISSLTCMICSLYYGTIPYKLHLLEVMDINIFRNCIIIVQLITDIL